MAHPRPVCQVYCCQNNYLSGPIPSQLGNCSFLYQLLLNGNQLSGVVPTSLSGLSSLWVNGVDLRWNALSSTDASLTTFLNTKQVGGDWQSTQTVAPTGLVAGALTMYSVALTFMSIAYKGDSGGYRAYYSTNPAGPYTSDGITVDKSASSWVVSGLEPGTTYYFVLRTVTNPHSYNQNTVMSDPSAQASASTLGPLVIATATPLPSGTVGVPYSLQFTASGGAGGYSWSVLSGSLPVGITGDGLLSGTPTSAGHFAFTLRVSDSIGEMIRKDFEVEVLPSAVPLRTPRRHLSRAADADHP
jgi:hypothetical protein